MSKNEVNTENCIYYDENYYGIGYLLLNKKDDEIVRFLKLSYINQCGFPYYIVRGYERGSKDNPEDFFRKINFSFNKDDLLYPIVKEFAISLDKNPIYSIDMIEQGENNLIALNEHDKVVITLSKDIYKTGATDYIDIALGDNYSCKHYEALSKFYRELTMLPIEEFKEKDIKKLLK